MTAPHQHWTVLPHEQLSALEDNVLTVVGQVKIPAGSLPRRMTAVRLNDGRLVVFSAIALNEEGMGELEAFGPPSFLIVPNNHHRLDARIWKDRYPEIKVIAPAGAREKVEKVVSVDYTDIVFDDPSVRFVTVPGTQGHEAALEVDGPRGLTLVLNDVVANIRDAKGFGGWLLRKMGFVGDEPQIPAPIKASLISDKGALEHQLRLWASAPALRRIVVSHGDIIDDNPQNVLLSLAATLD